MIDLRVLFFLDTNIISDAAADKKYLISSVLRFLLIYLQRVFNSVSDIRYKVLNDDALSFSRFMM